MSGLARRRPHRAARIVTAGFGAVLAAGMLVIGPSAAHAASVPAAHAPLNRWRGSGAGLLSSAAASARAQATGKPVVASALTTPTSQTVAKPGGLFTVTQTLLPVRAYRNGAWRALDPDLRWNGNHTLTPAVTTDWLVLSGGGTSPLAVMTAYGRSMSLWWPTRLPVPSVSGATATYQNVLPGVNLEVTVNPQGGLRDVLVIKDAAAAANPALASLRLRASTTMDLHISADAAGNLRVATSAKAEPVFTSLAPQMWDSAGPAAGTKLVSEPGAGLVAAPSGVAAYSSASSPGVGARVWQVPLSVAGTTIRLAPPRSALTARGLVFPLYIDPSFQADPIGGKADNWTQVDSGFATTSYWNESSDLQLGYCDFSGCDGLGVARDYMTMPISTDLATYTHIDSAYMYMTDEWSASCTKEAVDLWTTGTISSSTTWDKQPKLLTDLQNQSFAYGYDSSCPYYAKDVTWTITSVVQADAGHVNNETFGLTAGSESNDLYWKQFLSGASNITITTNYHNPPNKPTGLENAPAGACETSYASESTIGADDVTLSATVGDIDDAEGDDSLATTFTVKSYATGDTVDTVKVDSGNAAGGLTVSTDIPRATVEGWSTDGSTTEYSYYWYATTSDTGSPVLTGQQSDTCYFLYNPLGPAAPGVSVSSSTVGIGTSFSATFTPQSGCSATTTPCPATFTYQLGVGTPVTVTPNNSPASGDWTGNITMSHVGPIQLTVYGTASGGNPGTASSQGMTGAPPATPYPDGYFAGGSYPSVLTTGTGVDPSLWLSVGTGNGTLAPAVDIGSLGTMINPGTDGPADWADTQVLHGNFTGQGVQDVMAYYYEGTHAGNGVIIPGQGDASTLIPYDTTAVGSSALSDSSFDTSAYPTSLVAAGDASETDSGLDDLIGVLTNGTDYELDLFSVSGACNGGGVVGGYSYCQTLSTTAPAGNWGNYAFATAQPAGNRDAVVLFALDKSTGALYVSVNPTCNETVSPAVTSGCEQNASASGTSGQLVGTTWSSAWTDPWGASAPDLVSADVNSAGTVELWTESDGTAIPYTVNFATDTVTQEGSGSPLAYPGDDWQLNDGSEYAQGSGATTATDSITGDAATINGTCTTTCFWTDDSYFSTVSQYDGSTTYVAPPAGVIPTSATSASLSVWLKTTTPDGVIASVQASPLSSGSTTPGDYNPVLYVGSDGLLQACWWPVAVIASKAPVDDGLWHHIVLTDSGGTETLTIDGVLQGTASGSAKFSYASSTNLDFGSGYIGGVWPDEPHSSSDSDTGYLMYFKGELADVTLVP
jgi:hypothetical protein